MDEAGLALLMDGYVRRKQWEARLLAVELWGMLGEALGSGKSHTHANARGRVPAGEALRAMGVGF
jgi:hypothetical protein